jgi:oxygen-independent coproporphyrinogen III oxidase
MLFPQPHSSFKFTRCHESTPQPEEPVNLYIHLPFCRRICAFCPYVKQVHDTATATAYGDALLRELQSYRDAWGEVQVGSIYFGGGTPSMTPELVEVIMSWLRRNFQVGREVGVEVHPLDATPKVLGPLRNAGVTMVSLGVQTFNDRLLALLGRGYNTAQARDACQEVLSAGFDSVDLDVIFALPGQSESETMDDIATACELGADQISCYPLINFADTPLGAQLRASRVKLPSRQTERRMLNEIVKQARDSGYDRSSIWSFNKPGAARYTTVTRDSFIGIGAGASSRFGDRFQVNTFDVNEYIGATRSGSPVALSTQLNEGDRMAYWLFWRCYDTSFNVDEFVQRFGRPMPGVAHTALQLLVVLGLARRDRTSVRLTDHGAYLLHLVEKQYTHSYLEPLWAACRKHPWPECVRV